MRPAPRLRDRRPSEYARIGGIPVAVFGVMLSLILLTLALWWIRTDNPRLLDVHYGLSLIGVIFEVYFLSLQIFVIQARVHLVHALRAVARSPASRSRW